MVSPFSTQLQSPITNLSNLGNFRHSTEIPGGFSTLSYVVEMTQLEWEWWIDHPNRLREIYVRENGGFLLWRGRLEDIDAEFGSADPVLVRFLYRGNASKLNDQIDNVNHDNSVSAADDEGEEIVLTLATDAGLSTSDEFITAATGQISVDRSSSDASAWRTIADSDGLLDIPSTNDKRIDFYVYEDDKVHYVERAESSTPWLVSRRRGDIEFMRVESLWRDYATSIAGRHSAGITAFSTDSVGVARTGTREVVVGNTDIDTTTATNIRDAALDQRREGFLRIEDMRLTRVRDDNQVISSLCRVRSGDTIRVIDLFSDSNTTGGVLNNRNSFYITATECVHRNGSNHPATSLSLRLDVDRSDLAGILIANGIRAKGT